MIETLVLILALGQVPKTEAKPKLPAGVEVGSEVLLMAPRAYPSSGTWAATSREAWDECSPWASTPWDRSKGHEMESRRLMYAGHLIPVGSGSRAKVEGVEVSGRETIVKLSILTGRYAGTTAFSWPQYMELAPAKNEIVKAAPPKAKTPRPARARR